MAIRCTVGRAGKGREEMYGGSGGRMADETARHYDYLFLATGLWVSDVFGGRVEYGGCSWEPYRTVQYLMFVRAHGARTGTAVGVVSGTGCTSVWRYG